MKILYDHQAFIWKNGGIVRYFNELIESLTEQNIEVNLSVKFSNNDYLNKHNLSDEIKYPFILGEKLTNRLASLTNRLNSVYQLKKGDFDIFHPTFFNNYFLEHLDNKPFVMTYHDCIKEKYNLEHLDNASHEHKQEMLNKASKIIAVSENTKTDLLKYYDIKAEKIEVIYHASNFEYNTSLINTVNKKPEKYLLYVGARNDYKNFEGLLKAFSLIIHKHPDTYILCAGSEKFSPSEIEIITNLGLVKKVTHQSFNNDSTLIELYQNAIAFVYPSFYEGFGIPILEAFACDCPVVLSNTSCFPEIAEEAALYFDPNNSEDMAHKLALIISDLEFRKRLIIRGKSQKNKYSVKRRTQATLKVYQSIL
jgi:glycosyltransferase involved in cell wall biosynthesis